MRRQLERIEIPGEHDARMRTWDVVRGAFEQREPVARERAFVRPVLVAVVLGTLVAAALSPPGRAVADSVGEALGVRDAETTLFSLHGGGRLLVVGNGVWRVDAEGGKRRLGDYRDASWSPFGRFVVAVRDDELTALEQDGDVRWRLSRPAVRLPRWGGSSTDTRIAYLSGTTLRVVAGDGRGDHVLARDVAPVAPAWRPATFHFLAYAKGLRVFVRDAGGFRPFWSRRVGRIDELEWSPDGELLLVRAGRILRIYDQHGTLRHELHRGPPSAPVTAAAFGPDSRSLTFVQRAAGRSHVWLIDRLAPDASRARELFAGPGVFSDVLWSPGGGWLLVAWRDADQWLFVRTRGRRAVRAVANVRRQFDSTSFPLLKGWVRVESP